jgi:glycosidase
MPKVNLENPEARDYMLSLLDYWHENATIKGWRLDVANEVSMEFWREFRKHLKALDEDYWIVGEVWGDGSPWLKGDQWDSVMNYRFRFATLDLLASQTATPSQYLNNLMRTYSDYGPQVSRNMMNLLGSHDTERFMTLVQGDVDRAKLGATLQFAWVGSPSIYYGDELGMEGGGDPDNRRGMRWDLVDESNEVLQHYRKLIALRDSSPALQSGDPLILQANDENGTFAYARTLENDFAVLAANSTDEMQTVTLDLRELNQLGLGTGAVACILSDLSFASLEDELTLTLDPYEAVVLVPDQVASRVTLQPVSSPVAHRPVPVLSGKLVKNNHHRR